VIQAAWGGFLPTNSSGPDQPWALCHDQVRLPRVDGDLPDADLRDVALEPCPVLATVEGDEQSELGAQEEQLRVFEVFPQDEGVTLDRVGDQRLPGLAVVGGPKNVRGHLAVTVAVEGDVGRSVGVATRLHARHPRTRRQPGDVAHDVLPGLAIVAG